MTSCNKNQEVETALQTNAMHLEKMRALKSTAFMKDVVIHPIIDSEKPKDVVSVNVSLPIDNYDINTDFPEICESSTLSEIEGIKKNYAADYSIGDNTISDGTIYISETKLKDALKPLIIESKLYLASIGLTDSDIQDLINETDADESLLIVFSLAMIGHDNHYYTSYQLSHQISLFPSAYAAATWEDAGHCALSALGADIFWSFGTSVAKSWTKAAIKKAFKAAAEKVIGPVGVALTLIDFSICMWG